MINSNHNVLNTYHRSKHTSMDCPFKFKWAVIITILDMLQYYYCLFSLFALTLCQQHFLLTQAKGSRRRKKNFVSTIKLQTIWSITQSQQTCIKDRIVSSSCKCTQETITRKIHLCDNGQRDQVLVKKDPYKRWLPKLGMECNRTLHTVIFHLFPFWVHTISCPRP